MAEMAYPTLHHLGPQAARFKIWVPDSSAGQLTHMSGGRSCCWGYWSAHLCVVSPHGLGSLTVQCGNWILRASVQTPERMAQVEAVPFIAFPQRPCGTTSTTFYSLMQL